jgi:hypothetical protein
VKAIAHSSALLVCALAFDVTAAQKAVEGFTSGANGWSGSSESFTGAWTFTGGVARISFAAIGIGFPDLCILSNLPSASSGAFTGNYDTAGISAIGFSFMAPSALPASGAVELEWRGSTSVYRRSFSILHTGVWHHVSASLNEEDKSAWTVIAGSADNFAAARQSVTRVALRVARSITSSHAFIFDDIFVAGQPLGSSLGVGMGGAIAWEGLLAGVGYRIEATTNLLGTSWSVLESIRATGYYHTTVVTNFSTSHEFFRISFR